MNEGHFGGSGRPAVAGFKKPRTYLNGDFKRDMKELRIKGTIRNPQTRKEEERNEVPDFIAYLTLALQNLSEVLGKGCDLSGNGKRETVLKALDDSGRLGEVASFLWLHRVDDPEADFGRKVTRDGVERPEFEWRARDIVLKLWELRNMFVHPTRDRASKVLVVEPDFYRFIEGELYGEARTHALGAGRKSEKVFKLKLFTPNNDAKTKYEFTRKGLIYFVCLALYRHDASEFIQRFKDMQLPPRTWEIEQGYVEARSEKELVELRKKGGSVKAIVDAFTYFSMRASRTDIDVENRHYLNFANILLYLNKVPGAAYNYLALEKESQDLVKAAADSKESEANRRFKYLLQERRKNRFLTLALAYIEDFGKLPCIKFKRLDITPRKDRKRYIFGPIPAGAKNEKGEELSDANGMDRHYAIANGVAHFEYVPSEHYGDIKITSLRGGIGENEIARLLLVMFNANGVKRAEPGAALERYLAAYHRILERMLNAGEEPAFSLDDPQFRDDFKTVSGKDDAALAKDRFVEEMKPFFSESITRFFTGESLVPDRDEGRRRLYRRFTAMADHAGDFLVKMEKLTDWKELDEAQKNALKPLRCKVGELKFPPRTCKINDAQLVRMVLRYINLYLSADEKYRQLPRGMRHRGVRDFEFQLLHSDIGRFGIDPMALWKTLEKREGLNGEDGPLETLKARERELFQQEQRRCRGKTDKNGRPLRVGHTLTMLATAAAELYRETCEGWRDYWCGADLPEEDAEILPYMAKTYGVRIGQSLDRDALVKTILGIDLEKWAHAYDYASKKNFEGRTLAEAKVLIAAEIPVPNDIARRCVDPTKVAEAFTNRAFRAYDPFGNGRMRLRDYYDVKPLIDYVKTHDRNADAVDPAAPGIEPRGGQEAVEGAFGKQPPRERHDFCKNEVNRAIQAILHAECQDKVLLACARAYWDEYMKAEVQSIAKNKIANFNLAEVEHIGKFFATPIDDEIGGVKVRMMPNDFARPAYGVITKHIAELARRTKPLPETDGVYSFYDLWLALRDIQREESNIRLRFLAADALLEALAGPPRLDIPKGTDKEAKQQMVFEAWRKTLLPINRAHPLEREEFDLMTEFSDRLRHPVTSAKCLGLSEYGDENLARLDALYRRFGCIPLPRKRK